jgi:hypothetical protein
MQARAAPAGPFDSTASGRTIGVSGDNDNRPGRMSRRGCSGHSSNARAARRPGAVASARDFSVKQFGGSAARVWRRRK